MGSMYHLAKNVMKVLSFFCRNVIIDAYNERKKNVHGGEHSRVLLVIGVIVNV